MERLAELRRTLTVFWMAVAAVFSFVPFLGNLFLSVLLGGRLKREIRAVVAAGGDQPEEPPPVDEGALTGRVYLVAGEESGDLHAANLAAAIRRRAPGVELRAMGGPRMEEAGCRLDFDLVRMGVMGVLPVLRSVGTYFSLFRRLLRMLENDPPDVLVPVDYPGMNLRLARLARRRGVKVLYYVAPQVWAWAPWRVARIARVVDRMMVILPFERELFAAKGTSAVFVGHPLTEHLEREMPAKDEDRPHVRRLGLLPGSRRAEIEKLLPEMLRAAGQVLASHPEIEVVLPYRRPHLRPTIDAILRSHGAGLRVDVVEGRTHETMAELDLALVASGTATLELAYYRVPMVVLYRVGPIGRFLARFLLITPDIALVNIVAGKRIVPEHLRSGDLAGPAAEKLLTWVEDREAREAVRRDLFEVRDRLLFKGVADRAAGWVLGELPSRDPGNR